MQGWAFSWASPLSLGLLVGSLLVSPHKVINKASSEEVYPYYSIAIAYRTWQKAQ